MNKKGLTWSTIVYAIIAVVVLIVLIWIFQDQINQIFKSLMGIIKGTTAESEDLGNKIRGLAGK